MIPKIVNTHEMGGVWRLGRASWLYILAGSAAAALAAALVLAGQIIAVAVMGTAIIGCLATVLYVRAQSGLSPLARRGFLGTLFASVVLVLIATDITDQLRFLSYVISAAFAITLCLSPCHSRRFGAIDVVLALFLAWGLAGSIYGRLSLDQQDNGLAFFFPLILLSIGRLIPLQLFRDVDPARMLKAFTWAALVFEFLAFLTNVLKLGFLPAENFRHERVYILILGLAAALATRSWARLAVLLLLGLVNFLAYPALTSVIACIVGLAVYLTLIRPRSLRQYVIAPAICISALYFFSATNVSDIAQQYFYQVGKTDNSKTRAELTQTGLSEYAKSPWTGNSFTENIAVRSKSTGTFALVPVHNDYLQIAIAGGVIGLALFVALIVLVVWQAIKSMANLNIESKTLHRKLIVVLIVGLSVYLVSAGFNPVMFDGGNSLALSLMFTLVAGANFDPATALEKFAKT